MSHLKSLEMEDILPQMSKQWEDQLDLTAASRGGPWLPAYGYVQQSVQDFFNHDNSPDATSSQQFFLETIVEESSDELCSESDKSTGGWTSDSDADSVIHVSIPAGGNVLSDAILQLNENDSDNESNFSKSTDKTAQKSNSLIAFESLEQHCEQEFRTSASDDPFGWSASDSTNWRFDGNPTEPLDSSSASSSSSSSSPSSSSDETLHLSLSSSTSFRSSLTNDSRLRVYRSFDSLNLLDSNLSTSITDLSQSHNALDIEKEKEREQEEFVVRDKKLTATTANLTTMLDSSNELTRGKLSRASFHNIPNRRDKRNNSVEGLAQSSAQHRASEPCLKPAPQQSAENLSEDSGFCDSRTQVLTATPDSSDCSGGEETMHPKYQQERGSLAVDHDDSANFNYGALRGVGRCRQSDNRQSAPASVTGIEAHSFLAELAAAPTSACSAYSPPRLITFCKADSTSTFHSPKETSDLFKTSWDAAMAGRLPAVSAPNLYIGDDASLTHVPLKDGDSDSPRGRGVTFCPVVSEVSWRNSYSESESVTESDPSTDEMSNRSLEDLCMGDEEDEEDIEVEEKLLSHLTETQQFSDHQFECCNVSVENAKVQPVNGDGPRPSVETQLVPPTRFVTPGAMGHVVSSDAEISNTGRIPVSLPVRDVHSTVCDASFTPIEIDTAMAEKKSSNKSRFGGFFERFSFRRLSNRVSGKRNKKKADAAEKGTTTSVGVTTSNNTPYEDVTIIPLHGPEDELVVVAAPGGRGGKPPLPPRVPGAARKPPPDVTAGTVSSGLRDSSRMPGVRGPTAIDSSGPTDRVLPRPLETDLDALDPVPEPERREGKKARSLMNLGLGEVTAPRPCLLQTGKQTSDDRARSMEFLLDKENQAAVMVPENELQKSGPTMSEHQLRVQLSLQKLDVPDWYRNSSAAQSPQGFLLKRTESSQGWRGLGSKTTSLSSLGSVASTRSPTSHVVSPSPQVFTRWSTSRLNSGATSSSTSPCGSARSSFHYRQPYLGWRSQERLTKRTPAERLAAGFLTQQRASAPPQQTPSLTEVRSSIKEVTSAIANYVSGSCEQGRPDSSKSPRGSASRLCWVESSFVGSRPMEQPETPLTADTRPDRLDLPRGEYLVT